MVQQQFFAKDLSFPMNVLTVPWDKWATPAKALQWWVYFLGRWSGCREVRKMGLLPPAWYLVGKTDSEQLLRWKKETKQKLGCFISQNLEAVPIFPIPDGNLLGAKRQTHLLSLGLKHPVLPTWLVPHPRPRALNFKSQDLHPHEWEWWNNAYGIGRKHINSCKSRRRNHLWTTVSNFLTASSVHSPCTLSES